MMLDHPVFGWSAMFGVYSYLAADLLSSHRPHESAGWNRHLPEGGLPRRSSEDWAEKCSRVLDIDVRLFAFCAVVLLINDLLCIVRNGMPVESLRVFEPLVSSLCRSVALGCCFWMDFDLWGALGLLLCCAWLHRTRPQIELDDHTEVFHVDALIFRLRIVFDVDRVFYYLGVWRRWHLVGDHALFRVSATATCKWICMCARRMEDLWPYLYVCGAVVGSTPMLLGSHRHGLCVLWGVALVLLAVSLPKSSGCVVAPVAQLRHVSWDQGGVAFAAWFVGPSVCSGLAFVSGRDVAGIALAGVSLRIALEQRAGGRATTAGSTDEAMWAALSRGSDHGLFLEALRGVLLPLLSLVPVLMCFHPPTWGQLTLFDEGIVALAVLHILFSRCSGPRQRLWISFFVMSGTWWSFASGRTEDMC